MKIILLILLSACTLLEAEYPRYKVRGPPYPPRSPTSQHFFKKWYQPPQYPPRGLSRPRPMPQIPVMMHDSHKIPMGVPPAPPRPLAQPVRTFWKNTQASMKFVPEKVYQSQPPPPLLPPIPEKPFLSAPSISMQELDYHLQTNNIPTAYINPIKQIGEKGPIHTIPAPNLSLRDKPIIVEEIRNEINYPHPQTYVKVEQSHQYQVTEQPEPIPSQKFFRGQQQQLHHPQQQIHHPQQQLHQNQIPQQLNQIQGHPDQQDVQQQFEVQNQFDSQQPYFAPESPHSPQNFDQSTQQGDIILNNHLTPQELYQLIESGHSDSKQQQSQVPDYQAIISQQLFRPEVGHPGQILDAESSQIASGQIRFQPEYQSFNYDEQAHQKSLGKKQLSSLVSAAYNLDASADESQYYPSSRNSANQVEQSEIVQNYFDKRSDVIENDVEPDTKANLKNKKLNHQAEETIIGSSYYSSLPNKETAERLAQLQAAGKVNSHLMEITSSVQNSNDPIKLPKDTVGDEGMMVKMMKMRAIQKKGL
ncbi:hypothetical protein JTB14_027379 [Gonioctena quinquepunctata]|nr:hypothetical protein JTB14_027379 [Gonioctena quinquepunctata]